MNLLTDALISIGVRDGSQASVSLPELYRELRSDQVTEFPQLRAHQAPAWHAFLVQLGVLAIKASGGSIPADEEGWRTALRSLTPQWPGDEPWHLVVDDWLAPAFLQPPCGAVAQVADYKRHVTTPDSLDVLVTSKNHDLKSERMAEASAEAWMYALVSLQTTEGFMGAGNYGIARMNGGFSSRTFLRVAPPNSRPGAQVFRDITRIIELWDRLLDQAQDSSIATGPLPHYALLWLVPWDGSSSLQPESLDPLFIEICRRVRLVGGHGSLHARCASSKVARVSAGDLKGVMGDPWAPIERDKEIKSYSATGEGFSYRRIVGLLDRSRFQLPLLAQPTEKEKRDPAGLMLHAAALARGQGQTEGFHSRSIHLSAKAATAFADDPVSFHTLANLLTRMAGDMGGKVLRPALIQLMQGKEDVEWTKPSNGVLCEPWMKAFDACVDARVFLALNQAFSAPDIASSEKDWAENLKDIAINLLNQAAASAPTNSQRSVIARARARNLFESAARKHLPALRPIEEPTS